jgi:hypothetical protein
MKKIVLMVAVAAITWAGCTSADLSKAINAGMSAANAGGGVLSPQTIAKGLKDALEIGIGRGSDLLSLKDGFLGNAAIKILFPPEAQKVEAKLRQLGLNSLVDGAIMKINRAAEDAAKGAKPIFVSAIQQMTFNDAKGILMGENNAATEYLKRTTSTALYNSFKPVIGQSLNKVGALTAWTDVISKYNTIPLVQKVNPDLGDHVTKKSMDGLFMMIQKEELKIRTNPIERTTAILKQVFAQQGKGRK